MTQPPSQRGYDPSSNAPTDILCIVCKAPLPESLIAHWLWAYNDLPTDPTCSLACAQTLVQRD